MGEPTDSAGGLRGLAADVVEGEAMEEGTGGVWGGTCNYRENNIVIATSYHYTHTYTTATTMFMQERGRLFKLISSKHYSKYTSFLLNIHIHACTHVNTLDHPTDCNPSCTPIPRTIPSHIHYKGSDQGERERKKTRGIRASISCMNVFLHSPPPPFFPPLMSRKWPRLPLPPKTTLKQS